MTESNSFSDISNNKLSNLSDISNNLMKNS